MKWGLVLLSLVAVATIATAYPCTKDYVWGVAASLIELYFTLGGGWKFEGLGGSFPLVDETLLRNVSRL